MNQLDILKIQDQINDYKDEASPWEMISAFKDGPGYESGAYYLKARPNSRRPGLYTEAKMNGGTTMSLNKGGINNVFFKDINSF